MTKSWTSARFVRRQRSHVKSEMGDDSGRLEDRSQSLLEMAGLVRLIADQDQSMRAASPTLPARGRGMERSEQSAHDRRARRLRRPGDRTESRQNNRPGAGLPLLGWRWAGPGQCGSRLAGAARSRIGAGGSAPRGRPTSRSPEPRAPAREPPVGAGPRPIRPCRCRQAGLSARDRPSGPVKRTARPGMETAPPAKPVAWSNGRKSTETEASPIAALFASGCTVSGSVPAFECANSRARVSGDAKTRVIAVSTSD